jgi:hypothetical protein
VRRGGLDKARYKGLLCDFVTGGRLFMNDDESAGAQSSRWDLEWCARCCRRLLGLNPGLHADSAFDLAQDLSHDEQLRARSPEGVAEDMMAAVELPLESQWGGIGANSKISFRTLE